MNKTVAKLQKTPVRRFKPYPAYKEPGVHWLGEVPAHWEVRRLKTIASIELSNVDKKSVEGQKSVRLCNYVDVYYNDRITPELDFMAATATADQVRRFSLRAGDVLITKDSESWTDIAVPAVVTSDLPEVLCGYHLALVRPRPGCNGAFLARAFSAIGLRDQFEVAANGITRFGLGGNAIQTGVFAVPSLEEQRAIAAFLDRETARIDALVAKKERLIELLREERIALITRAVTKGLDPNVPMKDSGIQWLGRIPTHWEVKPLKRVVNFTEGPGILAVDFVDDGIPLLRISGIGNKIASLVGCSFLSPTLVNRRWSHFRVQVGDLLISGSASTGLCSEVDDATVGAIPYTGIIIVRPIIESSVKEFVRWFFLSSEFLTQTELAKTGSTIQHFGPSHLSTMALALPPVAEQRAIANHIDRETARIDVLVAKVREAIDHLNELRTALISAVVTGKIDVREEVA